MNKQRQMSDEYIIQELAKIEGMDDELGKNAVRELAYVVGLYKDTNYSLADIDKMNNATPEQKAEAVLKAYGRWTTTEEGL